MLKYLYIALLFLISVSIFAQEPLHYTTKQGLPSNHIYDIQEDANGFMWFATNRGLAKFDGETFKTFTIQDGLPNNDTWLLDLDYQGRLWYFSKSSYQGYIVNDSIYKFQTEHKNVITPRLNYKTKDSLWFFSNRGVQTVQGNIIKEVGFFSNNFSEEKKEKLLKEAKNNGLKYYSAYPNPETRELILFSKNEIFFYDWDVNYITTIEQNLPSSYDSLKIEGRGLLYNNIYYNAFESGILFVNFNLKTSKYIPFSKYVDVEKVNYFKCKGLKDEIQISFPGHLLIFNYNLELVDSYSFPEITNSRISYKDSRGNIWLANFTEGVTLIPNTQLQSSYYLQEKKAQKLGYLNNQIIVGVNEVGFYKLLKQTNKLEFIPVDIGDSNGEIYQIKSNPNYLISARTSFTYHNNKASKVELNFVEDFQNIDHSSFKDIADFNKSKYFIITDFIVRTTNNHSKTIVRKTGLLHGEVFKDKLYFTGSDGLHRLENDSLIKPSQNNELLNTSILAIIPTENNLLVGTDGRGVYSYDEENIVHLKNTDGLSVQRIIKKDSVLWLATQNGVKKIALSKDNLENSSIIDAFYEPDGLLQNNVNDIYLEDNLLYVASDIGLSSLDLKSSIYKQNPKLYFKIKQDTLQFKNEARDNISVSFSALEYVNQEYLSYQYRLLPEQKEWVKTDTKTINFSNLSPDDYTLEVKATDQHNNSSVIKQYLNVVPKWWQTTSAFIGFGLVAIGVFIFFVNTFKKQIQKREEKKSLQDKRIAGLELQALRSQMNPHFVHNSLNAIKYFVQRNEVELSEDYLVKFSKLIRLFFEYSRRQTITIKEELELLTNYLEIEQLRFEEKLRFKIKMCNNIDPEEQIIPSMLLQPIVENSVNHGLFHKQGIGNVSVDFKQTDANTYKVTVKDDGIGINKAQDIYKQSSKNYQSNSSTVLHERLDLLNQSKEWNILYNIEDRSSANNGEGTIVTLIFNQPN